MTLESQFDELLLLETEFASLEAGLWSAALWKTDWARGALAISAYTAWERFVEVYVIALVSRSRSPRIPHGTVEALLTQHRNSLEFQSLTDLQRQVRSWVGSPTPFDELTSAQASAIENLRYVRNAVAHDSRRALNAFQSRMNSLIKPITWLKSSSSGQTELARCLSEIRAVAQGMP